MRLAQLTAPLAAMFHVLMPRCYPTAAGLDVPVASSSQTAPGEGVWATVGDRHVAVGRREWVQQRCAADAAGAPMPALPSSSRERSSDTEVWVGWSGQGLAGRLLLSDALRPDAAGVVSSLRQAGLRVMLLSGDRPEAVAAMAAAAGIRPEDTRAGVRPEGKAQLVRQLRAEGRRVAMVGDGVNDAPALACADVGVAMGGGTAVAGDAAGVVLLGDRLGQVGRLMRLPGCQAGAAPLLRGQNRMQHTPRLLTCECCLLQPPPPPAGDRGAGAGAWHPGQDQAEPGLGG